MPSGKMTLEIGMRLCSNASRHGRSSTAGALTGCGGGVARARDGDGSASVGRIKEESLTRGGWGGVGGLGLGGGQRMSGFNPIKNDARRTVDVTGRSNQQKYGRL